MANFREVQFPHDYILNGSGGQRFNTIVIPARSGYEQRNINWSQSRGRWTLGFPARSTDKFKKLIAFHRACYGMGYGFRFQDPADYSVTGQTIGTGNGVQTQFQLVQTYTSGPDTFTRTISKPVTSSVVDNDNNALANTVHIYFGTTEQLSGWSANYATGLVTFISAPPGGTVIKADFQFDVPVRFDTDNLEAQYLKRGLTGWPSFDIVEVRV